MFLKIQRLLRYFILGSALRLKKRAMYLGGCTILYRGFKVFKNYLSIIITILIYLFSSSLGLTDSAQLSLLQNDGSFVILCTLYLLLGLALLAMCFSIFRDALWHYPRLSSCFGIQNHYYCGKDGNSHPGMLYSKSHLSSWVYNETPS